MDLASQSLTKSFNNNSLGLLDEYMLDGQFETSTSDMKNYLSLTPKTVKFNKTNSETDVCKDVRDIPNTSSDAENVSKTENGETTLENVYINDVELNELENEFSTFSDEDSSAEEEQNGHNEDENNKVKNSESNDTLLKGSVSLNRDLSCIHEENDTDLTNITISNDSTGLSKTCDNTNDEFTYITKNFSHDRSDSFNKENDTTTINDAQLTSLLSSMYFKPSQNTSENDDDMDQNAENIFESILKNTSYSALIQNLSQSAAFYQQQQQGDFSFGNALGSGLFTSEQLGLNCTFKSTLAQDEFDEAENKSDQSWWNVNQQQLSKLDLTVQASDNTLINNQNQDLKLTKNIDVDQYFERKSSFPSEFIDENRQSLDNLNKIDMANTKNDEKLDMTKNDDITFQDCSNLEPGQYSFTFNTTCTGELIKPKIPTAIDKSMNLTMKSENKVLNTTPSIKSISEELERIQNSLMARGTILNKTANDENSKKQINKNVSCSSLSMTSTIGTPNNNNNNNNKASSTSTPVKNKSDDKLSTSTNSQTQNKQQQRQSIQQNHIFCQESFISSIPSNEILDSDATLISGIPTNQYNNELKKGHKSNAEIQTSPLKTHDENYEKRVSSISTTTTIQQPLAQQHQQQPNFNQLISNNMQNGAIPFFLIPPNAILPLVQILYGDINKRTSDANGTTTNENASSNQMFDFNSIIENLNFQKKIYDASTASSAATSIRPDRDYSQHHSQIHQQQSQIPQIDIDKLFVDFGNFAEGCSDFRWIQLKCLDRYIEQNTYLLIELYNFEIPNLPSHLRHLESELKFNIKNVFNLKYNSQLAKQLRVDLAPNQVTEICVDVNATNMSLYKNLLRDLIQPIDINAYVSVSSCSNGRKILLNKIEIRVVYGYVRLKTSSDIETINFVINKKIIKDNNNKQEIVFKDAHDTQLQSIPLSNAGNIPITLNCYLCDNIQNEGFKVYLNKNRMELNSNGSNDSLEVYLKKDSNIKEVANSAKIENTRLIVEVVPHGFKYEIPVRLKCLETIEEHKQQKIRILASKTLLAFNSCNPNEELSEELIIKNPNNFTVRCVIHLITYNNAKHEKCDENLFVFNDIDQLALNNNDKCDQKTTKKKQQPTIIQDLKANQTFKFIIKFQPTLNFYGKNDMKFCEGLVRITSVNYELRCHVKLFGFIGRSQLHINSNYNCSNIDTVNSQQRLFNFHEQISYRTNETKQINLTLYNRSIYSKCFIVPLILNDEFNKIIKFDKTNMKCNIQNDYLMLDINNMFNFKIENRLKLQNFNLIFLWIEYDLFLYCYQYMIENKMNLSRSSSSSNKNDQFNLDDFILTKLFSSNADFNDINDTLCSLNTTHETNLSVLLKSSATYSEKPDVLLKYFKKSLKATLIKFEFDTQVTPTAQYLPDSMFRKTSPNSIMQRYSLKFDKDTSDQTTSLRHSSSYSSNFNRNDSTAASTILEQGTLLSEHSSDTLSLTPLINASFLQTTCNNTNEFVLGSVNRQTKSNEKNVKILRSGNDAHIAFSNIDLGTTSNVELTLTNPTKSFVRWKAYSIGPALTRSSSDTNTNNDSTLMKCTYSVFFINPTCGVIPPSEKQIIRIDFSPRELCGIYTQHWEIDTRSDMLDLKNANIDSYSCKLLLDGIAKSFNKSPRKKSFCSNKENQEPKTSTSKTNTEKMIHIKETCLNFTDTEPMKKEKLCFLVNNPLERTCVISILPLVEPFYVKYSTVEIKGKHYCKVPIEFRPTRVGDYEDKVLLRLDTPDSPILMCKLIGRCKK